MKNLFLVAVVAGFMSACAPTSNTTSSTGTPDTDSNTETMDTGATGTDTNTNTNTDMGTSGADNGTGATGAGNTGTNAGAMESNTTTNDQSTTTDTDATTDSNAGTVGSPTGSMSTGSTSSEIMGEATTMTMSQLPQAVRDAYDKMPGHANATGEKVSQVKTSQYPVLYKIEGTSGSTQYVHYFTPEGNEVQISDDKK